MANDNNQNGGNAGGGGYGASFGNQMGQVPDYGSAGGQTMSAGAAQPAVSTVPVKDITTAEFMPEVLQASQDIPVLVDFWAPWCGPCKQLAPALEKVVSEAGGRVKLVKMNIDDHPEVASQMGIQSIPAVVAFVGGRPADAFMGAKPESEIRAFVEKLTGPSEQQSQIDAALDEAEKQLSEGAIEQAAGIYIQVLQAVPDNLRALTGLGLAHLENDDLEAAKSALDAIGEAHRNDPRAKALAAAIELKEQAGDLGELQELMDRVGNDPKDFQARFDLAIGLNAKGKREEAADQLLGILRINRGWNEEAAKTQLLQFFDAWGPMDEATKSARRQLSSILFS